MWHITKEKIKRRLRGKFVRTIDSLSWRYWLYPSYWHYRLHGKSGETDLSGLYHCSRPNAAAGIGHQVSNWAGGCHYAQVYGIKFAYIPFADKEWDNLLAFGAGETSLDELLAKGWRTRRLPLIRHDNEREAALNSKIVKSYAGQRIVFVAEQDQFYYDLPKLQDVMQSKFYAADKTRDNGLVYTKEHFNIAIHVRRGDILTDLSHPDLKARYLANDYFERVLENVLDGVSVARPVHIYFFSQGTPDDFKEFWHFANLHWCMDMSAYKSFEHLVHADLLITSKSSFSYKPALLSHGIKVCPPNFWHPYPSTQEWIVADSSGSFDSAHLKALLPYRDNS